MGNALWVYGTSYKVKKSNKNFIWGDVAPSQIVRTRVILLYVYSVCVVKAG